MIQWSRGEAITLPQTMVSTKSLMKRRERCLPPSASRFHAQAESRQRAVHQVVHEIFCRAYRLIEWTAQWLLETHAQIHTDDLPGAIAVKAGIAPGRDGRYQAGLHAAWMLVGAHVGGAPAAFISAQQRALLDHLQCRNHSILAHGFAPIRADEWRAFRVWLENAFIPMLQDSLQQAGVHSVFPQLPDIYPLDTD